MRDPLPGIFSQEALLVRKVEGWEGNAGGGEGGVSPQRRGCRADVATSGRVAKDAREWEVVEAMVVVWLGRL